MTSRLGPLAMQKMEAFLLGYLLGCSLPCEQAAGALLLMASAFQSTKQSYTIQDMRKHFIS